MKPINIYTLTRIEKSHDIERLEKQMSMRKRFLKIKKWEMEGLYSLCSHLSKVMNDSEALEFFYSFTMPKIGKEFDLLRINGDYVVNIELKSGNVSDETIKKQLIQNKYYLSTLSKNMYFYTFISSQNRLVRLSNSGRIVDCEWEELAKILERQNDCYDGNIEELFKEENYLISPLTDVGRFLRQDYFLTLQQKDIRKLIMKQLRNKDGSLKRGFSIQGFTGLPGTGKTILLYDIAMQLSKAQKVCVLHFGSHEKELEQLDERLKRIDFYYYDDVVNNNFKNQYFAILVDEGHRVDAQAISTIINLAKKWEVPVIISYDREEAIAPEERIINGTKLIEDIDDCQIYKLTNRIRMNSEISIFVSNVMCIKERNYRRDYPSVSLAYANDDNEANILLQNYEKDGFIYIWDDEILNENKNIDIRNPLLAVKSSTAACKEFDKVVMIIDESFYYNDDGFLRCSNNYKESRVRNLYHGLSRAKKNIAIVVKNNIHVFDTLLFILQK